MKVLQPESETLYGHALVRMIPTGRWLMDFSHKIFHKKFEKWLTALVKHDIIIKYSTRKKNMEQYSSG